MERSAIKNLSSINTFKSLKNVENCSEEAHKGQLSVQLSVRKTTFLSRICRSVLSSSGYEGVMSGRGGHYAQTIKNIN